ncbi:MAG: hypothetical protein JRC55_02960 [Deltaproteobacteria bacterium]|nr:hypothetical protein [Deltaproteobacteria bacterium]
MFYKGLQSLRQRLYRWHRHLPAFTARAPLLHNSSKERPVGSICSHGRSSWKDIHGPFSNQAIQREAFLHIREL